MVLGILNNLFTFIPQNSIFSGITYIKTNFYRKLINNIYISVYSTYSERPYRGSKIYILDRFYNTGNSSISNQFLSFQFCWKYGWQTQFCNLKLKLLEFSPRILKLDKTWFLRFLNIWIASRILATFEFCASKMYSNKFATV